MNSIIKTENKIIEDNPKVDFLLKDNSSLFAYLAGLLEGDGCITFSKNDKGEYSSVRLKFTFNKDDEPYVEFLQNKLKIGTIGKFKDEQKCIWYIDKQYDVFDFLVLIKDYFRTAKIITLNKAFDFFSTKYAITNPKPTLDNSFILSNAWLAGFSDADSSFMIQLSTNNVITFAYQIKVAEYYILNSEEYLQYRDNRIFMQPLADAFNRKLLFGKQKPLVGYNKETSYIRLIINKTETLHKVIEYFTKFPLFSSKYLNYLDWKKAFDLRNQTKSSNLSISSIKLELKNIRNNMNSKRDPSTIKWDHLNHFYNNPINFKSNFLEGKKY